MLDYERNFMCYLFEFNFDEWLDRYDNFDVYVRDWHTVDMWIKPRIGSIEISFTTK